MQYKLISFLAINLIWIFGACSNPTEPNKGPGTILNIYMPDSLMIPDSTIAFALVRAEVEDPDGLKDIKSVYFHSQKPDGEYANSGNPIDMVDDGTFGDEVSGDGIYSMGIQITNEAQLGTYIFTFEMKDKSNNLSSEVVDSIEVYN